MRVAHLVMFTMTVTNHGCYTRVPVHSVQHSIDMGV